MDWQVFFSWAFKAIGVLFMVGAFITSLFFSSSILEYNRKLRVIYTLTGLMALSFSISVIISNPELWLTIICFGPILLAVLALGYYLQTHVFSYSVAERKKRRESLS
jgi:hypothetical protein